ncbi:hypothetical protein PENPOL_c002G05177 [Penicillium polonicum]|uniref:Uncharacterized protein n=1 Tax=Penicillium polonicum TaxID=60169 RepID=A0A1V6NW88_PENPO|nr:hypothetical protein PENPOL_c002G05177 [Penicillium polonicum]
MQKSFLPDVSAFL